MTVAALVGAPWAMLLAPSRATLVAGGAALVVALTTAALWWVAVSGIPQTT